MPRKSSRPPVKCEFFTWRLFERDGVWYADGRYREHHLGKHSLATRDASQALERLHQLDRQKATELGIISLPTAETTKRTELALRDGWEMFMTFCQRGQVLGGASPKTYKRYRAVRDKHLRFCAQQGLQAWEQIDKTNTAQYENWLRSSDKTCIWHAICAIASLGRDSIIGEVYHGYRVHAWRVF